MARILIIEDNPANLELMVYLLNAFAHTPLEAHDGQAGLEVARREKPDLILCDLQLPDIEGYEVARQIRHDPDLRNVPLVAVTAYAMVGDRDKVLAAGFNGYITKPIAPETFVSQVEAFIQTAPHPTPSPIHSIQVSAAPKPPKGASILVVDDSPVNLELLRSILEPSGYEVQMAGRVSEALALARQAPPDLILADLHMPVEDGYDLLRAVKTDPQLEPIAIIILSATVASSRDGPKALALGATKFLINPIEPQALLEEIEACLKNR
jgi:two-component system cell cycle response regulator